MRGSFPRLFLTLVAVVLLAVILATGLTDDVVLWVALGALVVAAFAVRSRRVPPDEFGTSPDFTEQVDTHSFVSNRRYVFDVDGERREYDSLDEVPADLRAMLEKVRRSGKANSITITVNGEKRTYDSIDDVPEEFRPMISRVRRRKGPLLP